MLWWLLLVVGTPEASGASFCSVEGGTLDFSDPDTSYPQLLTSCKGLDAPITASCPSGQIQCHLPIYISSSADRCNIIGSDDCVVTVIPYDASTSSTESDIQSISERDFIGKNLLIDGTQCYKATTSEDHVPEITYDIIDCTPGSAIFTGTLELENVTVEAYGNTISMATASIRGSLFLEEGDTDAALVTASDKDVASSITNSIFIRDGWEVDEGTLGAYPLDLPPGSTVTNNTFLGFDAPGAWSGLTSNVFIDSSAAPSTGGENNHVIPYGEHHGDLLDGVGSHACYPDSDEPLDGATCLDAYPIWPTACSPYVTVLFYETGEYSGTEVNAGFLSTSEVAIGAADSGGTASSDPIVFVWDSDFPPKDDSTWCEGMPASLSEPGFKVLCTYETSCDSGLSDDLACVHTDTGAAELDCPATESNTDTESAPGAPGCGCAEGKYTTALLLPLALLARRRRTR